MPRPRAHKGRAKTGKYNISKLQQETKALELRLQGLTLEEIAKKTGFWKDRRGAYRAVTTALKRATEDNNELADELRTLELERLDKYLTTLKAKIRKGDTRAIDTALRIMDRRAKLLGLDAPAKSEVDVNVSELPREQLIAGAVEQLRAMGYTVLEPDQEVAE